MSETNRACPWCGGDVKPDLACHTYPQTRGDQVTWMACMPCDSATIWFCVAHHPERCFKVWEEECPEDEDFHEGCGWSWTQGLNPDNPRVVDNETRNPHWEEV